VQTLSLPVFILNSDDSTAIYSDLDSIYFSEVITALPDTLVLKESIEHRDLELEVNYPLIAGILIIAVILLTILFLIFGKPIRKRIKLVFLRKDHQRFIKEFETHIQNFENQSLPENLLTAVVAWKKYMEKISKHPYMSMTTRELDTVFGEHEQSGLLKMLDRGIYGGKIENDHGNGLVELKKQAERTYGDKITEIKNG
jgi:hypothetical protein